MSTDQNRPIYEIADDIRKDWGKKIYFGAKPYLEAMLSLTSVTENYIADSADSIIRYFLANANTYRGENARKYKQELKKIVGIK